MAGNGNRVIALDAQRMTAMSQGDVGTLTALIADELVYTHSSARLDTKQSLIENMQSGNRTNDVRITASPATKRRVM